MEIEYSTALATLRADPANPRALEALAKLHPGNGSGVDRDTLAQAMAGARGWHEERGDIELCVQLLDFELGWTPAGGHRADLLVHKARFLHRELMRTPAARACLQEALETAPGHRDAVEMSQALDAEEQSWESTAREAVKAAKAATEPTVAAEAWTRAAEQFLKFRPKAKEGEGLLKRALDTDPRSHRAEIIAERVLREGKRTEELVALFDRRIASAITHEERANAEAAAGALADEIGRPEQAIEHFRRALSANPAEPRALHAMVRVLTAQERWTDLLKVYEAALRFTKRGPAELPLLLAIANLQWKYTDQAEQAELFYRRVRKANPLHPAVIEFYRNYHMSRNEHPQVLALLAQAQKAETNPERRIRLGIEMAELAEQRPQSVEKAIDAWKAVLKLRAGLPEAVAALRRLYTKTEKWNALLELLKDDLEALPREAVDEKVARYLEMIPIYRDRLRLEVMVINTYVAILSLRPDHPDALKALAERYEAQGRWGDLVQIFTRQAEATPDPTLKVTLYHRVAALWAEKFNKQQNAIAALEKILQIDPLDTRARTGLKDIYVRGRSWRPLLDLMRREAPLLSGSDRRNHLVEMARLAAERTSDLRQAIALWNDVLLVVPDDSEALTALAQLYEREKRWPALAEILARQAAIAGENSPAWAALLERRGVLLHEKMKASRAALDDLRRIQSAVPDNARVQRALREIYSDLGDFSSLESLYAERGAYDELSEVLSGIADRTNDLAARTSLLERVAEIAESKLQQPERALKAYEKILATDPDNQQAARAAAALYRKTERWGRLLATYEILLGPASAEGTRKTALSPDETLKILSEARRICEQKLNSKSLAFQWGARAYELAPNDAAVLADLERLAEEADEWEALGRLLQARLSVAGIDREERVGLLRRALRISLARLGQLPEARRYAEELLALKPEDDEAETALQQIFTRGENWAELVGLLLQRQSRTTDRAVRVDMLFRIARIQEEKISDRVAAAKTFRELVELDPQNLRALRALGRALESQRDWAQLADVLKRQAELCPEDERAATLLRLGQIQERELAAPSAAVAAYLRALEADPISGEAVAGIERLVAEESVPKAELATVCQRLAPYYELTESYDKWADSLETLARLADSDRERMPHLELLTHLYGGPLANHPAAFRSAVRMFEIEPGNFLHRERLLQVSSEANSLGELVTAVRAVLKTTEDADLRRDLLAYVAEIEERRPDGTADAEAAYRQILELDPLHFSSFRSLTRLYRDAQRWSDLRDLLGDRQEHLTEVKDRVELLSQVAEIDESVLNDRDHAIKTLQQLLALQPDDLRFLRSLERHFLAAERWGDLDEVLTRQMALVPPLEATDLKLRRAEVAFTRFEDPATALSMLESVLQDDSDHAGARALLERILEVPSQRQRAAAMLEPLYEESGNWQKLVSVLQIQRDEREGMAAAALLTRIAEVQEQRLQSRQAALVTWRQLLETDPSSVRALAEFERLATILERYQEQVDLYQELARKRDRRDIGGAASLYGKAARLFMVRFSDRPAAIRMWRKVLDLDATNVETAAPAAEALEALYVEAGDFKGLVEVLRAKLEWTGEKQERTALLLRIAALEEKSLGDVKAAVATYRTLLETDGDNIEALNHLERTFEATGQHRERVEILSRRVGAADPAAKRELRFRIAAIYERELDDIDEAISAVLAILDEAVDDGSALDALARLYEKKGATAERMEILERRLVLAKAPSDRVELLRQIAELLQGPLGRPGEAFDRWREILQLAPRDPGAIAQLEHLLSAGDEDSHLRSLAAQALEPIYESAGDWDKLARVLRIYIDASDDPHDRMTYRVRLAELQDRRLNDRLAAFTSYGAAIRDALGEPGLPALLESYERLATSVSPERVDEVVTLYRSVEPDVMSDDVRGRLQRAIARHAQARGEGELAATYYRKILERSPDDTGVLAALEVIYRQANDGPALYDVILQRAELASAQPADELALRLQAGALALELGRNDEAISAYERVWTLRPGHPEAVAALDRLYLQDRQWSELGGLLERQLALGMTERESVGLHFRIAGIELQHLRRREKALEHLAAVLRGDPDHAEAIRLLEEMLEDSEGQAEAANLLEPVYVRRNAWSQLVAVDKIRLEHTEDPAQRLAWTERIARIYEEQIEDLDEAFRWYGRVFKETPTDRGAQEQLVRLAPKLERWPEVARLLGEYLDDELSNSDEVLRVVRLCASVHDEQLNDQETARKYYRRYIEAQPTDRAASEVFERALERWEAWRELRDLLEEQATRLENPDDRIAILRRSAKISEDRLESRSDALDTLKSILDLDASDPRASAEVERLLRAEGRWSDLRDHLIWALDRETETFAQDALAIRLAEVEQKHLDNTSAAVERYGEVLARTPAHPTALAALESLISDVDQRPHIAEILEPLYRQSHDARKLAEILEIQLETMDDPVKRTAVWREIADLEERAGRLERALEARGKAWLEDVSAPDTLAELEALAATTKRFARLVQILQEGTESAGDPDLSASLHALRAKILETKLGDAGLAVEAWREALAARSDDVEAFLALERLLAGAGRSADLADTLEKHIEIVSDVGERKALSKRMAVLYEQVLKQRDRAVAAWRSVLELDDADPEALEALSRLYIASESWRSLAEIYQRKIELASDAQSLRALRFLTAQLHDEKLEEPFEAASQLRSVLDVQPGDAEALEMLDRIFTREGQNSELLEVLDRRALAEKNPTEREVFAFRAARLLEEELSDVQGAVDRYQDILGRSSSHAGARDALWALARGEDYRPLAVPVLEPILRASREWGPLVELLELRLSGEDAIGTRLEILAEIARIEEQEKHDPERAFAAWARAFAEDPSDAATREALERLAAQRSAFDPLVKVYEDRLRNSFDAELQRFLAVRLAELTEEKLNDPARAVAFWTEARELPGDEAFVLSRLEALLRKLGRDAEVEEVLSREAEVAVEPAHQADYWAALGDVRLKKLGNVDEAIDAYRSALDRVPTHPGALAALRGLLTGSDLRASVLDILEPLAEGRNDYAELVVLYEARLGIEDEHAERASWLRRIAELSEQKLNDRARALDALGRALVEDPLSFQTADDIERLARATGAPTEGARRIEAVLDALEDSSLVEMALRAARLYEEATPPSSANDAAAEKLYERALATEAESAPALTALEALYRRRNDGVRLAAILERRGALELEPEKRTALYGEAARLHEERGDLAAALRAWRAVREADEGNLGAISELARLYEREGKMAELVAVLEDEARFVDDGSRRAAVYVRIGNLKAGPIADLDGAAVAYREALDVSPQDQEALAALAAIEEKRGDYSALEEALLRQLTASTGTAQVAVLFKLAENASRHLEDDERALSYLHQVLDADAGNRRAFLDMERLLSSQERWHDLIDLLERRAEIESRAGDTSAELACRAAIAEIWANRLGSPESAIESLEKILSTEPTHGPSLLALARIYEASERWDEAQAILEKAASVVAPGRETAEIHFRVGRVLAAKEGSARDVEAHYLAALEADSTHAEALEALEGVARKGGNLGQLVQILELREQQVSDDAKRRALLSEVADLYTTLGNPTEAIGPLQRLAQLVPTDLAVQENLGKALVSAGRVEEGERILVALVEQMSRAKQNKNVARLQQVLGSLAESRGDLALADERLAAAYQLDPTQAATLAALARLAVRRNDTEKARRFYRSLLLHNFDEKAVGITKGEVYFALGKLHLQAGEIPKARNMFERGVECDPQNAAFKQALAELPK